MTYTSVAHVQPQQAESPKWYSSSPIERQYPTAWCKLEFESFLNTDSKSGTRCAVCLFIRIDKRLLITRHIRPVYTLRCYMAVSTIALSPILQESSKVSKVWVTAHGNSAAFIPNSFCTILHFEADFLRNFIPLNPEDFICNFMYTCTDFYKYNYWIIFKNIVLIVIFEL